jgi:hypothetical protein
MKASPKVEIRAVTPTERVKAESSVNITWKRLAPLVVTIGIALIPAPAGLAQHAWYFFAIFAGVIVRLMFEPLPGGAIGLIGVTVVTLLARWVLYGPADLAKPGFNATNPPSRGRSQGFRTQLSGGEEHRLQSRPRGLTSPIMTPKEYRMVPNASCRQTGGLRWSTFSMRRSVVSAAS